MAEAEKQGQLAVLKDAFAMTRKNKPLSLLWCALAFVVVIIGGYFLGKTLHHPVYFGILGIPVGILVAFFLFTRFANSAAFASIEDQLGA